MRRIPGVKIKRLKKGRYRLIVSQKGFRKPTRGRLKSEKAHNWYAAGIIARQLRQEGYKVRIVELRSGGYRVQYYKPSGRCG